MKNQSNGVKITAIVAVTIVMLAIVGSFGGSTEVKPQERNTRINRLAEQELENDRNLNFKHIFSSACSSDGTLTMSECDCMFDNLVEHTGGLDGFMLRTDAYEVGNFSNKEIELITLCIK